MDVYVARQPIFDRRMKLYGYELLYRKNTNNYYEGTDDNDSTAALIGNTFLVIGFNELIDGTRGFINFSQGLLQKGIPSLLPKDKVVVEILERVQATPDVITACKKLKANGYTLALDDFCVSSCGDYAPLVELADIIKIEYPVIPAEDQLHFIRDHKGKRFLAEKVETHEEYQNALKMGYHLFQGYFFSKPLMVNARDIGFLNINLLNILKELQTREPDYGKITAIIQKDLGLSYKLMKMANSVYYGAKHPVSSIQQALTRMGIEEMIKWIDLMLLKSVETTENSELIKTCMIRGRMLSLTAIERGRAKEESDYYIAGIFSALDVILGNSMRNITQGLPLSQRVKDALLGVNNDLRVCLDATLAFERAEWQPLNDVIEGMGISHERYMALYLAALKWQQSLAD